MGTASPTIQAVYSACLGVIPHALIVIGSGDNGPRMT